MNTLTTASTTTSTTAATSHAPTANATAGALTSAAARRAERHLRAVLTTNAITSAAGGLFALAFGGVLDELLSTGHPGWVRIVGAGLLLFAIDVALVARAQRSTLRRFAPIVSIGDTAWVGFTAATIAAGWYSTAGAVVMGAVGVAVATFGIEQYVLARRMD